MMNTSMKLKRSDRVKMWIESSIDQSVHDLSSMEISVQRESACIFVLGSNDSRATSRGKRTVGGSLCFSSAFEPNCGLYNITILCEDHEPILFKECDVFVDDGSIVFCGPLATPIQSFFYNYIEKE